MYSKMAASPVEAFKELGHEAYADIPKDIGQNLNIVLGSSAYWDEVKNLPGITIAWNHGVDWYRGFDTPGNIKIKSIYNNCSAIAYQSEFARLMTWKAFGERLGPIILNTSKPDFIAYPPRIDAGEIFIATTAIWRMWKRLEQLELIIDFHNKNYGSPRWHLYVYGKDLKDKTIGDPTWIHYLGMSEKFEKYDQCLFYTQLSFNDYSPKTIGEAMARGLPVVATNSGGAKDIIGDSGIIIECDPFITDPINIYDERYLPKLDRDKVINSFQEMLNNIRGFRSKTRDRVVSFANAQQSAKQFLDLYASL